MFKFLHVADIHLDSPLTKLSKYPGAPLDEIRLATRGALANLVQCALEEQVAFVVIAGDVYDGDWDDYNTGHFFNAQMVKLAEARIPVYLLSGNHDAANKMTRNLQWPPNVRQFPTHAPATFLMEDLPVALHGQGFATASIKHDLSLDYPAATTGRFNVGVLHTSVDGREGHDNYAPCTLAGLAAKGYDYWALGHVHKREILREQSPMIAFPGNLQGRHVRETGAKGCLLIEVDDNRQIARQRFQPLDVFRWELCEIDVSDVETSPDLLDRVADHLHQLVVRAEGRASAARVVLSGACALHDALHGSPAHWTAQIRAIAVQQSGQKVWVEKVKFRTTPLKADRHQSELDGPMAELSACIRDWSATTDALAKVSESLNDVKRRIPAELLEGQDGLRLDDPDWLRSTLADVEQMLIGRLLSQESP